MMKDQVIGFLFATSLMLLGLLYIALRMLRKR